MKYKLLALLLVATVLGYGQETYTFDYAVHQEATDVESYYKSTGGIITLINSQDDGYFGMMFPIDDTHLVVKIIHKKKHFLAYGIVPTKDVIQTQSATISSKQSNTKPALNHKNKIKNYNIQKNELTEDKDVYILQLKKQKKAISYNIEHLYVETSDSLSKKYPQVGFSRLRRPLRDKKSELGFITLKYFLRPDGTTHSIRDVKKVIPYAFSITIE